MGKKWMTDEEKARIIAWRGERVKIREMAQRSGRSMTQIKKLLKAAKDLPINTVPQHKRPTGICFNYIYYFYNFVM